MTTFLAIVGSVASLITVGSFLWWIARLIREGVGYVHAILDRLNLVANVVEEELPKVWKEIGSLHEADRALHESDRRMLEEIKRLSDRQIDARDE